ncbi:MAG: hypothetical protein NTY19_27350 [Planctomycetota bacterium]|nr:hypothetical protein [Planctomycetota bacterium]
MTGQDVLGEDKQPNFGDRAVQAATVKLTNVAVVFGITKSSFDHLSPDLVPDFDLRILHLFSMSIQNLLAFELLQCAAFVWVTTTRSSGSRLSLGFLAFSAIRWSSFSAARASWAACSSRPESVPGR